MNMVLPGTPNGAEIAALGVEAFYSHHPSAALRYPAGARDACRRDMLMHLIYVEAAAALDSLPLLIDYLAWVRALIGNLGLPVADLRPALDCLAQAVEAVRGSQGQDTARLLRRGLRELDRLPPEFASLACSGGPLTGPSAKFLAALLAFDYPKAAAILFDAVEGGADIAATLPDIVGPAMREVGRLWHRGQITVAEEHAASAATQVIMARFYPRIFATERRGPVLVAACAEGELHEMGLRMVTDQFQLGGWETHFLGASTPPKAMAAFAARSGAAVVAVSAMTVASVPAAASLIALLRTSPGGNGRKILAGGYPFSVDQDLWRRVGADGTAADGRQALALADDWVR
ncbi:B12-binding domain-containing protein [Magnetospirillum sp. UT-4]|uniref:cobalamin B12-binding domain-containing protein n=1 Tax=Magnetospirillum sp. UT-4 TaxID=2681467 RepID=UPI00137DD94C|nr:cobalamin-dependent protein [Magnetospirillum sp. UT-4]CAA7619618.1 Cobalamin B12-binding domain protein [Magnetospirillum sp. UT-4]